MLQSTPSQDVVERAKRAEARLQAALRLLEASRLHAAQPSPIAAAVDSTPDAPRLSSTPAPPDTLAFTACIPHLEWPLAPLMERAKAKRLRDAQRQRRRATAAAATAAAQKASSSSMSAADVMRTTLAQPLGVMAARLLSAATASAPSLFADSVEAVAARVTSPPPSHLSPFSGVPCRTPAGVPMSSTTAALPGATVGSGSYKPLPSLSTPAARQDSGSLHTDHTSQQHRRHHHHHYRHGGASYSQSPPRTSGCHGAPAPTHTHASLSPRPERGVSDFERRAGRTSSLLSLPPDASPTRHGGSQHRRRRRRRHHHTPHCRHTASPLKPIVLKPSSTPPDVPSSSSTTHAFFGKSPISLLARTFGAGMAVGSSSPTVEAERRFGAPASAATTATRHGLQLATTRTLDTVVSASGATPPAFASPPRQRRSFSAASLSSPSTCSCSRSSCSDEWGCSSWTPSDASLLSPSASANVFGACLTAPGPDGVYDPRAALPSLQRCYGNALTHGCFEDISSTSTAHTASRSSTPFSSEWSVHSDGTGASATPPPPPPPEVAAVAEEGSAHIPPRRRGSRLSGAAPRVGSPNERSHADDAHSHTALTQLSFAAEMDAIEKGQMAPYVSYLFSPEARVVDLGPLEGQLRRGESTAAPAVSATCVRFCSDGAAYLVGTSSGLLWRVPVGGAQEAVRATPLGSLWPPAAQSLHPTPTTSGAGAAAVSVDSDVGGVSSARAASPPPALQQPVPLAGHTAAVLSIAFNDDGTLFATTGLDGCVIVWNASTSAKLRRISAVWSPQDATAPRAPHLVRFMPQNNNYLLVSYRESSELHLYNSSTGLPVTNVAGTGLTRVSVGGGGVMSSTAGTKHLPKAATKSSGGMNMSSSGSISGSISGSKGAARVGSGAITALAVDLIASPFFVSGDAEGTVMLWSYRAGDLVTWPTLRATSPPTSGSGSGASRHARTRSYSVDAVAGGMNSRESSSSFGGGVFATPLYQLPELRRVTACVLPPALGGVGAINVTSLHAAQLHSLLRPCGPQQQQEATDTSGGGGRAAAPPNPLEATAHVLHTTALVNRACREAWEAAEDVARRGRRDGHGKGASELKRDDGSGKAPHTQSGVSGGGSSGGGFPHVLAALPSKLSDTFSALWGGASSSSGGGGGGGGGGGSYGASTAASLAASLRKDGGRAATAASASPSAATGSPTSGGGTSTFNAKDLLRQVRNDALDVVCPLLILVSTPSDTVYALGLLLQLQHGTSPHGGGGGSGGAGASGGAAGGGVKPTVGYRLYPLLKTTGPSRMRHVGVGAVASPDNHRLVVVAAPCEEGFMRVLPLLRLDPAVVDKADGGDRSGGGAAAAAATLSSNAARVNKRHVLATLPMPYGGRCTGLAWSPNGRFLVAITAEGVIYQWSRVYLFNTHAHGHAHRAAVGAAPVPTKRNSGTSSGGADGHGGGTAARAATGPRSTSASVHVNASAAAAAAASTAAHRRGCDTEYSDTVHQQSPSTFTFTSLLGSSIAAPAGAAAAIARESDAARAAFSEEDAWRQSLRRELERQRREQAAVKLVTQPGAGEANDVSSSGYWLDEGANSRGSRNTFDEEDEETERDDTTSCS